MSRLVPAPNHGDARPRPAVVGVAGVHPLLNPDRATAPQDCNAPSDRAHLTVGRIDESVADSAKTRYVPEPTLLLLNAVHALHRQCAATLAGVAPERIGLFVDPGPSYWGIQEEFFRPVAVEGKIAGSPLLFPHTSDASVVSIAAVCFHLQGPCLVVEGNEHGEGPLNAANGFLQAHAIDAALVGAVQHLAPALFAAAIERDFKTRRIPWVDCAAAALLIAPWAPPPIHSVPELERHLGHMGPCRWLFAELWKRHAKSTSR